MHVRVSTCGPLALSLREHKQGLPSGLSCLTGSSKLLECSKDTV